MKSYSLSSLFDFRFSVSQNEYLLELIFGCSANGSDTKRGDNQSAKLIYLCSIAPKTWFEMLMMNSKQKKRIWLWKYSSWTFELCWVQERKQESWLDDKLTPSPAEITKTVKVLKSSSTIRFLGQHVFCHFLPGYIAPHVTQTEAHNCHRGDLFENALMSPLMSIYRSPTGFCHRRPLCNMTFSLPFREIKFTIKTYFELKF